MMTIIKISEKYCFIVLFIVYGQGQGLFKVNPFIHFAIPNAQL